MVKNKERIVQYLIEVGYVEQAMTKDVWLKQYDTIDCCVSLNEPAPKIEWYPHGDYSRKSVDISTQPALIELNEIILNISKTNHMPSIFDTPKSPTDQATESPEVIPSSVDSADITNQPGPTPLTEAPLAIPDSVPSGEGEGPPVGKSLIPEPSFAKKTADAPVAKTPKPKKEPVPAKPSPLSPPIPDVLTPESVGGVPALPEKSNLKNKTDSELDRMMDDEKAKRWLEGRGKSYKVHGIERPDAASIQRISNMRGVSTGVISAVQTSEYAEATVRAYAGNIFVDSVVHHDFNNYRRILIMERIKKNPEILDCWNGEFPVLKPGAQIKNASGNFEDAMYTIMHSYFTFIQFALRDAVTKAEASAQAKILNQEFREKEDIDSEQFERDLISGK